MKDWRIIRIFLLRTSCCSAVFPFPPPSHPCPPNPPSHPFLYRRGLCFRQFWNNPLEQVKFMTRCLFSKVIRRPENVREVGAWCFFFFVEYFKRVEELRVGRNKKTNNREQILNNRLTDKGWRAGYLPRYQWTFYWIFFPGTVGERFIEKLSKYGDLLPYLKTNKSSIRCRVRFHGKYTYIVHLLFSAERERQFGESAVIGQWRSFVSETKRKRMERNYVDGNKRNKMAAGGGLVAIDEE